jgi:hypothetical protein
MTACLPHSLAETKCAHVDVRLSFRLALVAQLTAPPPDPRRGLFEFRNRGLPFVLGFGAVVGEQVCGGEGAVPQEARPDYCSWQRGLQARGVRRRQLEALDEEPLGFLGAYLGRLLDMRVHQPGEPPGVDRVLVGHVEFGEDVAQHRPDHVGRQPRDPVTGQELLGQRRLTHAGRAADEVEDMASHDVIVPAGARGRSPARRCAPATDDSKGPPGAGTGADEHLIRASIAATAARTASQVRVDPAGLAKIATWYRGAVAKRSGSLQLHSAPGERRRTNLESLFLGNSLHPWPWKI